ncbi:hypothetical protein [Rhizobium leguminosarum]|uniref:hypothetical protein n=1 Tax=Rhizobium leguminosarum TaxID=384 RepID=UPI0039656281
MEYRLRRSGGETGAVTTSDEVETWLSAPWEEAKSLQRPLPDELLKIESLMDAAA